MKNPPFHERRRQQFLYEDLYVKTRNNQFLLIEGGHENKNVATSTQSQSSIHQFLYLELFWIWMLDYTAGVSLDELAPRLAEIVDAFEKWNEVDQLFQQETALEFPEYGPYEYMAAPSFSNLFEYENTLQLLSIAIMLRDRRSIMRMIHIFRAHRGQDGLFEQLIGGYVDDEIALDTCVLGEPYDTLLALFYEKNNATSLILLKKYLKNWYPAMKDHPRWYDGHLRIKEEGYAPYYGYWAFEAGAAVFLLGLDDSNVDHLVYPADLVDYGRKLRRENRHTSLDTAPAAEVARIEGGQPCPQTGYWETPAKLSSRSYFAQGDRMPVFDDSAYGETIWHWSAEQE